MFEKFIDNSLSRLNLECIDLLQIHCPPIQMCSNENLYNIYMRLKDYLHNFDITVEDFADKADIPYTTMNKYVHGQRVPSKNYMKKIILK